MEKVENTCLRESLVPLESKEIQKAMRLAAKKSVSSQLCEAHLVSTFYAVKAIALAFFSTFAYAIRGIARAAIALTNCNGSLAFQEFSADSMDALRCLFLSAIGIGYVGFGFFLPRLVYPTFAPLKIPPKISEKPQSSVKNSSSHHEAFKKQIQSLTNARITLEAQLKKEKSQSESYKNELCLLKSTVTEKDQEIKRINERNNTLPQISDEEKLQLQEKISNLIQDKKELQEKIALLEQSNKNEGELLLNYNELIEKCKKNEELLNGLNEENKKNLERLAEIEKQIDREKVQSESYKNELCLLKSTVAEKDQEIKRINERNNTLPQISDEERLQFENKVNQLIEEQKELQEKIAFLEQPSDKEEDLLLDYNTLLDKYKKKKELVRGLQKENLQNLEKLANIEKQIGKEEAQSLELKGQIDTFSTQIKDKEKEINALKESYSDLSQLSPQDQEKLKTLNKEKDRIARQSFFAQLKERKINQRRPSPNQKIQESKIQDLNQINKELKFQLVKKDNEVIKLNKSLKSEQNRYDTIFKQLEHVNDLLLNDFEKIKERDQNITNLETELKEIRQKEKQTNETINRLEKRNQELERKYAEVREEIENLQVKLTEREKEDSVIEKVIKAQVDHIQREIAKAKEADLKNSLIIERQEMEKLQSTCDKYEEVKKSFESLSSENQNESTWNQLLEEKGIQREVQESVQELPEVDLKVIQQEFPDGMQMHPVFDMAFGSRNVWKIDVDDDHLIYFKGNQIERLPSGASPAKAQKAVSKFVDLLRSMQGNGKIETEIAKIQEKSTLTLLDVKTALRAIQVDESALMEDLHVIIFDEQANQKIRKSDVEPKLEGNLLLRAQKRAVQAFNALLIATYGERLAHSVIARMRLQDKEQLTWLDIKRSLICVAAQVRVSDFRTLYEELKTPGKMMCKGNLTEKELSQLQQQIPFENLSHKQLSILERAFRCIKIGPIREEISHALAMEIGENASLEYIHDWGVIEGRRITSLIPINRYGESMDQETFTKLHPNQKKHVYDKFDSIEEFERLRDAELWAKEIAYYQNSDKSDSDSLECADGMIYPTKEGYFKVIGKIPDENDAVVIYFYEPFNPSSIPEDKHYPLVMTCRGTVLEDPMSMIRDLDTSGVGKEHFDKRSGDILKSLLHHLEKIEHDNVVLKIYGHSLGAVDVQRVVELVLGLLEGREDMRNELTPLLNSNKEDNGKLLALMNHMKSTNSLSKIKKIEAVGFNPPAPEYSLGVSVQQLLLNRMFRLLLPLIKKPEMQEGLDEQEKEVLSRIRLDHYSNRYTLYWGKNSHREDIDLLRGILEKKNIEGRDFLQIDYVKFGQDRIQKAGDRLVGAGCTSQCSSKCQGCKLPLTQRGIYKFDTHHIQAHTKDFRLGAHRSKAFTACIKWPIDYRMELLKDEQTEVTKRRKLENKLGLDKFHYGEVDSNMIGVAAKGALYYSGYAPAAVKRIAINTASRLVSWMLRPPKQIVISHEDDSEMKKIIQATLDRVYRVRGVPLQQILKS